MDTRFVESLIAVVEHGSIVAAAHMQSLTPAAVSQRIQVLERDFGCALLARRANSAQPTPLCLELLPGLRDLVERSHRLLRQADPALPEGIFRLGAISTMLTGLVPQMLHHLRSSAPDLELRIAPGSSAALYDAVAGGSLDAALIVAPPFDLPFALTLVPIRREALCLLAPQALRGASAAEVFERLPLVAYDPRAWGGQIAQRYLRDHGLAPRTLCELDGLEAISDLVASGIGASVVPNWPGLTQGEPLPDGHLYTRQIGLLMPKVSGRPACQRAVLDSLPGPVA